MTKEDAYNHGYGAGFLGKDVPKINFDNSLNDIIVKGYKDGKAAAIGEKRLDDMISAMADDAAWAGDFEGPKPRKTIPLPK